MAEQNRVQIVVSASGAAETAKILNAVAKEGGQLGSVTAKGAVEAEKALTGMGASAKRVFEIFAGVNLAHVFERGIEGMRAFIAESSKLGREQQLQEATFKSFAQTVGVAGDVLAAQIEKVSGGIIDSGDAMKIAMRGLSEGLQPAQIVQLTDAARQLAKSIGVDAVEAYQDLTEAIATGQSRRLKEIGITIDQDEALKKYAASIGTTADQLSTAGKTQALFVATMEKAGPVIESNRKIADEFGEAMQRLKVAWQDVKETVGVFVNDTALAILKWFEEMRTRIPDMSESLKQLGVIWTSVWEQGKANLEGLGVVLTSVIIPALKLAVAAAAAFGVGLNAAMSAAVGPATFLGSVIGDLAEKKWPDLKRATLEANVATAEARVRLAESVEGFEKLAFGTTATATATKEMATATDAGTNRLGALSNQVKATLPDLKAMAAAVAGIAQAFKALSDEAARGVFPETDVDKLNAPLDAMRDKMREQAAAAGLSKAAIQALDAELAKLQATLVGQVTTNREALESSQALYKGMAESVDAARMSIEAMEFSYEKWLETLNAGGALDEAKVFYQGLSENIASAAQSVETMKTPLDDAARSSLAFQDSLAAIGREAALMGPSFDAASAELDLFKRRILELQAIKNPTGEILAEIDQLKAKFADTRDFIQWRTMFENVFASVGDAINTLVQGVILGTQTMGEAFKRLGQAIITQFVNAIIQQALNPLVKAAAGVVAGLFSSGARVASAGGGGSSGDIDIGGPSMSVPSIPTGIFDTGTLSNLWSGLTNGWAAFNEGLDAGASTFDALTSSWDTFTTAFGGAASGLSVGLAGVGAAVAAFGTIMDFVNGKTNAAIGGVTGAVVGGVAGGLVGTYIFPGVGTALGALVGSALGDTLGSWLGGMFGGPSNYELKRIQAADEANKALGNLTHGFEDALKTFNSAAILGSLQAGGAGGSVRSELVLPAGLAQQIGLSGQQIGDQLVTQWSALTLEQFDKVIAAFRDQPDLIQNIRGSGDVPLLAGGDAEAVAQQIAQGAQSLLTAFEAMLEVRDKIRTLAVDLTTAANEVLPPGAADAFAGRVNEFRDRMLAVLSSGLPVAEMQKQMDALEAELRNYTGLVDLYSQNTQLIAKLSADFVTQTRGAVLAIRTSLTAADRAVANAQAAATRAMTPEAELKATTALRDAIVSRYQMEIDMAGKLEASLAQVATKQAAVQQTLTGLAVVELDRGDATAFNEIHMALADMAMVAPTTAQRLFAVGQGLSAVLAALPSTAKNLAGPEIVSQIQSQVAPFFSALGDMIQAAAEAGDLQGQLGLLEQQADLVKQVGSALVQAVNDWAAAASDAVRTVAGDAAADVNKNWDAFADASRAAADAMRDDVVRNWDAFAEASHAGAEAAKADINKNWDTLKTNVTAAAEAAIQGEQDKIDAIELATKARQKQIDLEIRGIEDATQAQQKAIAAQIDGLQEQLAAAKEWEGAARSIADFVLGLKLGNQAPSNPADQLALAQSEFAKAQAAFAANPTAAGAGDAQKAAQDVLTAAGNVLTRTSPEYQKLFGEVVSAMEGIGGTAGALAPVSSADIEKQTEVLRAQSQAIGEDAAQRIDALREESTTLNETAREQIEVLRGGIETIKDLLGAELTRIDAARRHDLDLVDDWLKVRDAEIKAGRAYDLSVVDGWLTVREKEIKDGRAHDLDVVSGWLDTQLAAIEANRKGTVDGIQDGMIEALRKNSEDQNRILGLLEGAQRAALDEITKGVPLEQFKAKAAAETVAQLEKLNLQIEQFLLGSGHATGLAYVPATGAYKLHQGERVLTREERVAYEGGMATAQKSGGGPSITYAPTVNVSGAGDPAMIKAMVEAALRRDRRDFLRELETGAAGNRLRS